MDTWAVLTFLVTVNHGVLSVHHTYLSGYVFSFLLDRLIPRSGVAGLLYLHVYPFEESPGSFLKWFLQFTSPPAVEEGSDFSTSLPTSLFSVSFFFF